MAEHARPHLHTHHRERHHSAIAGAAYRLGLKLFDEQTGKWHDYSKRAGKEVVFGETLGPPGTPAWLLEPGTLWNEVEKAEGRERAQIARDYRIPVPLGLGEAEAIAMGKQMAGYIIARFNVPVTLAVHRDNSVDMDGVAKPDSQVGFHCHLYFPTRELVRDGEGEGAVWYLGRKLSELSNKNQSAPLVDAMNAKWSVLANRFARDAGLTMVYESKSYARLGLDQSPKPVRARRYGAKNGWFKGPDKRPVDDVIDLTPGLRRKQKAERTGVTVSVGPVNFHREALLGRLRERRAAGNIRQASVNVQRAKRRAGMPIHGKAPLINRVSFVGGRTLRLDAHLRLAELMRNAGPRPTSDAEQAALERSMFLADYLESLLFAQERARQAQGDFEMAMLREDVALADARARKAVVDASLHRAEARLSAWLVSHPLRARFHVPSDDFSILKANRDTVEKQANRIRTDIHAHVSNIKTLVLNRDIGQRHEDKIRAAIVEKIQAYKPDFRAVVGIITAGLSDVQRNDIANLADELGVAVLDVMSSAQAEAPFVSTRKTNP